MLLSDYISQVQFLVHDATNADFSQVELVNAINNARTAVSLDFHCVRQLFIAPPNNAPISPIYTPVSVIQNVEAYPLSAANGNNGQVVGVALTSGGSGYTSLPTVSIAAGPAGSVPALAQAVIQGGVVTQINMTQWGQGYTPSLPGSATLPTVTISGGGGSGAAGFAVMFNNVFNVISISYIWGNQRYMLKFRGFTFFQAYMRALLTFTQRALIWTIHEQSGNVLIQPPPDQAYVSEWDVLALPLPLPNTPSVADTQVVQPWADAVQYYAAMLCLNKLQNFEQAEYYLRLYSARVPKIIIGAGGIRIPNPYHRTFQRRVAR
ncbi:MAG TPA: hypothetical protein VF748_15580 [Candidatus Acidoferrum sp.]